jgi:hypothetical protein
MIFSLLYRIPRVFLYYRFATYRLEENLAQLTKIQIVLCLSGFAAGNQNISITKLVAKCKIVKE